jgi:hypothetical protein
MAAAQRARFGRRPRRQTKPYAPRENEAPAFGGRSSGHRRGDEEALGHHTCSKGRPGAHTEAERQASGSETSARTTGSADGPANNALWRCGSR